MEHHSANQFLKAATNLNVVQPKLFQATRQDDLRFSDCTVSVIQILDDADAAFRILGAGLRTVLSVTTMFADKPHRLNGRMCAAILCFDDLASGYGTRGWATRAAGYRAAISCIGTFRKFRSGSSTSAYDARAVITCTTFHNIRSADVHLRSKAIILIVLVSQGWHEAAWAGL